MSANHETTTTEIPTSFNLEAPSPYIKIAMPISVRELRTLLENIPGGATISDANPFYKGGELGIYRGESDRPNLRNP